MKKRILALTIATTTLLSSMTVFATPKTMPDGGKFDAEFYSTTYPDVAAVLGTNEKALYAHYITSGKAEGRLPYAANGEQSLSEKFNELKYRYPEGTPWDNEGKLYEPPVEVTFYDYVHGNGSYPFTMRRGGYGCVAFAYEVNDYLFGVNKPVYEHRDYSKIRVGDVLRINEGSHSVVVMDIDTAKQVVTVCEGNLGSKVHWGRRIPIAKCIDDYSYISTRIKP